MWVREAWERAVGDRPSRPNTEGANSARSSYRLLSAGLGAFLYNFYSPKFFFMLQLFINE